MARSSFFAFFWLALGWLGLMGSPAAQAQAPTWQTLTTSNRPVAGSGGVYIAATATDANGDVYVAGSFVGTVAMGSTTLVSSGSSDAFVARLNSTGAYTWAVRGGGAGYDISESVAVSGGNVYVAGSFASDVADFGSTSLVNSTAAPSSLGDMFVAKLTDTGSFGWAKSGGGGGDDGATGVAANGNNVYVVGAFNGAVAHFGSSTLTNASSLSTADIFVVKLTDAGTSGSYTWAQRAGGRDAGGADSDEATAVAVSGSNVYITGTFATDLADFGSIHLTNAGSDDVFIAKLTDTGTFVWAQQAGGTSYETATAITVNNSAIYITGNFSGTASFGSASLVSAGNADVFVAKLTDAGSNGSISWAARAGGAADDYGAAVAVDASNVYVVGSFTGATASFGSANLTNNGPASTSDLFVSKLIDVGSLAAWAWTQQAGSSRYDGAKGVAVNSGRVWVAGAVSPPVTFSALVLNGPSSDFLASLTDLPQPTLTSLSPNHALAGGTIALNGTNLGGTTSITFSGSSGNVVSSGFVVNAAGTQLTGVVVPGGASTGPVFVTTTAGTSNGLSFTLDFAPVLTSAAPSHAATGNTIALNGTHLTGTTVVVFSGSGNTSVSSGFVVNAAGTQITGIVVPGGAQTGGVLVSTPNRGDSNALPFTIDQRPRLTTASPNQALTGATIVLNGTYLAGATDISFGGSSNNHVASGYTINAAGTQITGIVVPGGAQSGFLTVTNAVGGSNLLPFYVGLGPAPIVTAATASHAPVGGTISLTGLFFTGTFAITFDGTSNNVVSSGFTVTMTTPSNGTITGIVVPPGATVGAGHVRVSANTGTSGDYPFTVDAPPAPTLASISPTSGAVGSTVTLNGTNLNNTSAVTFAGAAGNTVSSGFVVNATGTQITGVGVPAGAATGNVTVSTPGGTSNGVMFTVTAPAVAAVTWTGAVSADWNTPGNWNPATVPTASLDATIPANATRMPLVLALSPNPTCANLTVAAGATLAIGDATQTGILHVGGTFRNNGATTLAGGILDLAGDLLTAGPFTATGGIVALSGTGLQTVGGPDPTTFWNLTVGSNGLGAALAGAATVRRRLVLNGGLTTNGHAFTLASDATGTAMAVNPNSSTVTGPVTVERYLSGPNAGLGYRHFSAPVQPATVGGLALPGFAPVLNAAYNTVGNTVASFPTFFGFEEARQGAAGVPGPLAFDQGWISPAALADALTPGRGYAVQVAGSGRTARFSGALNTGPVTVGALSRSGSGPFAGYHLLGNPYAAPLNWADVAKPTGLDDAVYVFRSSGPYTGQYDSFVNGMGTLANGQIAAMQGFFVRVSQPVPVFAFFDAARASTYADPAFQRGPADVRPRLDLALRPATGPAASLSEDHAFVYFEAGASAGFDARFDAAKLPNPGSLSLASVLGADAYAINGLPPLGAAPRTLPLALALPTAGAYTLTADQFRHFAPGQAVVLTDAATGARQDLQRQPRYAFTAPAGAVSGRFALVFGPASAALATAAAAETALYLFPNPARATATLTAASGAAYTLRDALGRSLHTGTADAHGTATLDLRGLAPGLYLVQCGSATRRLEVE